MSVRRGEPGRCRSAGGTACRASNRGCGKFVEADGVYTETGAICGAADLVASAGGGVALAESIGVALGGSAAGAGSW